MATLKSLKFVFVQRDAEMSGRRLRRKIEMQVCATSLEELVKNVTLMNFLPVACKEAHSSEVGWTGHEAMGPVSDW